MTCLAPTALHCHLRAPASLRENKEDAVPHGSTQCRGDAVGHAFARHCMTACPDDLNCTPVGHTLLPNLLAGMQ